MNTQSYAINRTPAIAVGCGTGEGIRVMGNWSNVAFGFARTARDARPNGIGNAQLNLIGQASQAFVGTASKTHAGTGVAMKTAAGRPPRGAPC